MLFLDVVAESLAVIRKHDDGRAIVEAALLQPREERADDLVGVGHLAVVGRQIAKTVRRAIRFVRLVEMEKKEEAIGRQRLQPRRQRRPASAGPGRCTCAIERSAAAGGNVAS